MTFKINRRNSVFLECSCHAGKRPRHTEVTTWVETEGSAPNSDQHQGSRDVDEPFGRESPALVAAPTKAVQMGLPCGSYPRSIFESKVVIIFKLLWFEEWALTHQYTFLEHGVYNFCSILSPLSSVSCFLSLTTQNFFLYICTYNSLLYDQAQ